MLRVHPVIRTSDLPRAAAFLRALGLRPAEDPAPTASATVFDAGSGRVTLYTRTSEVPSPFEEGSTHLAFDVGDVREFARRTLEAGTLAEVSGAGPAPTARVDTPDGDLPAGLGPRDPRSPARALTVVAHWRTMDPDGARRVLGDIGATPRVQGAEYSYRAKNGGVVTVHAAREDGVVGDRVAVDLAFEYDGDVRDLLEDLTAVGSMPVILGSGAGRALRVDAPWGARLHVHRQLPEETPGR